MTKGTHSRGKAIERAFAEHLERELGARCTWIPPMGKWGLKRKKGESKANYEKRKKIQTNDIFGLFDVVYISATGWVHFAQICHPNSIARHRRAINVWYKSKSIEDVYIELWTYDKAKAFRFVEEF